MAPRIGAIFTFKRQGFTLIPILPGEKETMSREAGHLLSQSALKNHHGDHVSLKSNGAQMWDILKLSW